MARVTPIILIMVPILLLTGVGALDTNLTASGFSTVNAVTPCTSLQCPAFQAVGCQASSTNCQFTTTSTYSFLNPNSPFTLLLEGNIPGFFINTFTTGEHQNAIYSGYTICIPQVQQVYGNETGPGINNFQCLGYTASGSGFFPAAGIPLNATSNGGNNSVWTIVGCQLVNGNYPCMLNYGNGIESFNGTWAIQSFYAFYVSNGTALTASSGCTIYGSVRTCQALMPWLFHTSTSFTCPNTAHVNGLNINATHYYCLLPTTNTNTTTTSLPNSFAGVSFIFGVILMFMGLGLALTSAVIGFSINQAGTRMAQVFGFGITIWSFIDGEFGFWAANNVLGFDLGTILVAGLSAMFFVGLYWLTESYF